MLIPMSNRASRKQEIVEVALTIAEDLGVTGVTTVAIARHLGFTEAALYRYFAGKTTILATALQELSERLFTTMLLELVPQDAKDTSGTVAQLRRHGDRFAARRGLLMELLVHASVSHDEPLQQAGEALLEEYSGRMAVFFRQAQELALINQDPSPAELSRRWLCQLLGGFVRARLRRETWSPAEHPSFLAFTANLQKAILRG